MLGHGHVLSVDAGAQMDGDAFAFVEDLDAAGGQARRDLGAGEAVGDGVTASRLQRFCRTFSTLRNRSGGIMLHSLPTQAKLA